MEQVKNILDGSLLWRALSALCLWFGRQWENSGVVQWFLHPSPRVWAASQSSLFTRLWNGIHRFLCLVYEKLRLEKLFAGSIFLNGFLWCGAAVALAPLLPTMAVLALALMGYFSLLLNLMRSRDKKLFYSPMNRYVWLYAAVYLAGTLFSVNLRGSLFPGLLSVAFILFAVVLENAVSTRRQLDALVFLMVAAAAIVSLYGVCQYLFGWGYQSAAWVDSDMFSSISFRVPSTLQNPNMLGQYLILTIPLGGYGLLTAKGRGRQGFYLACCGVMCVCMVLTLSRGAWLGLLFAGAVFVVLLNPRLILLAPVALVALYFVLPDTVISRFTSIGNLGDSSTSYRVYIWMGTLAMLKEYWLCGIGPGDAAFNLVYPAYSYSGIVAPHAHNLFLQMVCDAGVAALGVFLLLLFQYFRSLCAAMSKERDPRSRLLQVAVTAGVCGFMVQAMTDYSFYNYRVMFLFWAYLGLGALAARRSHLPRGGRIL